MARIVLLLWMTALAAFAAEQPFRWEWKAEKGTLKVTLHTEEGSYVYFVHSYYALVMDDCVAQCDYITPFSAALNKGNFYATQFHPEKSGSVGERILHNFLTL